MGQYIYHLHGFFVNSQRKVIRIIKGVCPRTPTASLFNDLRILELPKLYKVAVMMFMYRYVKGELPNLFSNLFRYQAEFHDYDTRNVNNFRLPFCRLGIVKMHVRYTGAETWNSLCITIDTRCSKFTFKNKLKKTI